LEFLFWIALFAIPACNNLRFKKKLHGKSSEVCQAAFKGLDGLGTSGFSRWLKGRNHHNGTSPSLKGLQVPF
jgi:hypothetical protein